MAKIKTYPTATPATDDKILFTDVDDSNKTKNATIASLAGPISSVPRSFIYMYKDAQEVDTTDVLTGGYTALTISHLDGPKTDDFYTITNGTIVYSGLTPKTVKVDGIIELSGAGNNNEVTIAMFFNGGIVLESAQTLKSVGDDPMPFVGIGVVEMEYNSQLSFYVKATTAATVTTESVNVVLSQL